MTVVLIGLYRPVFLTLKLFGLMVPTILRQISSGRSPPLITLVPQTIIFRWRVTKLLWWRKLLLLLVVNLPSLTLLVLSMSLFLTTPPTRFSSLSGRQPRVVVILVVSPFVLLMAPVLRQPRRPGVIKPRVVLTMSHVWKPKLLRSSVVL